jgi:16S rRNA G966 N2-methylase RsmD
MFARGGNIVDVFAGSMVFALVALYRGIYTTCMKCFEGNKLNKQCSIDQVEKWLP